MRFAPVDSAGFLRMSVANLILFEQGVAKVATLAELQSCEAWKRAFQNKCKDHRYYEIVEDTLQGGFQFRYLVLQDESGEVRAVQPVFFVRQNLVEGVPGEIRSSLIVLKDFPAKSRPVLETFSSKGYARIPSMPMTRLPLHYKDYDIAPYIDEAYPLYLAVHERSPLKFEMLTKNYFRAVGQRMAERARFFIWRQSGKIVAFSFCLVCDDAVYDECIGLDYSVALDLHLYFYTLRDIISWALRERLKYYYSNPLNYEPKLHLDCDLVPLDLYVLHTNAFLNPIFGRALKYLGPTRHDPILRRFPNADQL